MNRHRISIESIGGYLTLLVFGCFVTILLSVMGLALWLAEKVPQGVQR